MRRRRFSAAARSELGVLRTVADVHALSPSEAARSHPVELHGVVTYFDPVLMHAFVQDTTGGIMSGNTHVVAQYDVACFQQTARVAAGHGNVAGGHGHR